MSKKCVIGLTVRNCEKYLNKIFKNQSLYEEIL